MRGLRLLVVVLGLVGGAACGSDDEANNNNNTNTGNQCLCYVFDGSGYDSCTERTDYGCDCMMGTQTTLEPPCS